MTTDLKPYFSVPKILELYFANKRTKHSLISKTFSFSPSKSQETPLGNLYLLGEIKILEPEKSGFFGFLPDFIFRRGQLKEVKNRASKSYKFLQKTADLIQNEYYGCGKSKPADCLNSALQKTNVWLSNTQQKNNVVWQNLNFAVVAISPELQMVASQIGSPKIVVVSKDEVSDISATLSQTTAKFPAVAEGKIEKNDLLIIFSYDLIKFLQKENILDDILNAPSLSAIRKIFKARKNKKLFKKTAGSGLVILAKKDLSPVFQKTFNSLNPLEISEKNAAFRFFAKIMPQSPALPRVVKKIITSLIVLAILLPLGWLLFRR